MGIKKLKEAKTLLRILQTKKHVYFKIINAYKK